MKVNLPTKADLLQTIIVDIDLHHKKVITNTLQVADYFGKRPSNINQRIASLSERGRLKIKPSYYLNQQGKDQKYYELNRDDFLLVVMGFTGDKADQFKANFIQLFNQQEAELQQWQTGRLIATDTTKQANDQIQLLKQDLFRINPSSNKARFLYPNTQKALNKAVTGVYGALDRETLHTHQLNNIGRLERRLSETIERQRNECIDPERIYYDVMTMLKEKTPPATKLEGAFHNAH